MYFLNLFFISSFLGYIVETILKTFFFQSINNGILYGPWIPIYGIGSIIIFFLYKYISNKYNMKTFTKLFLLFLSTFIIISFLEWCGGMLIEKIFDRVFWDYSNFKFNIGNYVSLEMSAIWGVVSLLFVYFIKPIEDLIIKKIPKWVSILVLFIFIIDVTFTILKLV